jgi:hypothetical protein
LVRERVRYRTQLNPGQNTEACPALVEIEPCSYTCPPPPTILPTRVACEVSDWSPWSPSECKGCDPNGKPLVRERVRYRTQLNPGQNTEPCPALVEIDPCTYTCEPAGTEPSPITIKPPPCTPSVTAGETTGRPGDVSSSSGGVLSQNSTWGWIVAFGLVAFMFGGYWNTRSRRRSRMR